MRNIDHLSQEEKQHYIKCACGEYVDMRDLSDVFRHLHGINFTEPEWKFSVRKGDPAAFSRTNKKLDLN